MGALPPLNGTSRGSTIYKVRYLGVRPFSARQEQQLRKAGGWRAVDESRYVRLLRADVASGALYFAAAPATTAAASASATPPPPPPTLLHRRIALQQQQPAPPAAAAKAEAPAPALALSEEYTWNAFLLSGMEDPALRARWGTPCISGFAASSPRALPIGNGGKVAVLTLVSRRSTRMQGTRFFRRGT